ncbi:MAG: hypothetical protein PWQ08_780 [Clostridiales bacterium]|jgi:cell fate (sporulation/competence/biofilm development) regulator YlbF (YheA/YmcA/DUF963 family)|nr:YlbF family regulator [Pygmaiobacter sp.]MDK2813525.1 hypothetical protein [Clostridiales bacterium]
MDIIEMTRNLGLEIQKDQRYQILENARRLNDADEELQKQIGDFNLARIDLNNEVSKSDKDADRIAQLNEKVQSIYTDIMNNESMQAYNEAKSDVDQMMQYINAILTTAVNGGDPMTVQEPSSCSGSCSSCSGCH